MKTEALLFARHSIALATLLALGPGLSWSCVGGQSDEKPEPGASPPAIAIDFPPQPEKIEKLYDHSVAVAEWAIFRLPKSLAEPIFILADTHRRFGLDDRAIDSYRRGLELTPNRPDILLEIGFLLSQRDDFKDAVEEYEKALVLDPKIGGARTRIAMIRFQEGEIRAAITRCEEEIANGTADAATYYQLGQARLQDEDFTGAETALQECLRRKDDRNALYGMVRVCLGLGRREEAETYRKRWQELRDLELAEKKRGEEDASGRQAELRHTADTYYSVGELYLQLNMLDHGLESLEAATIFHPEHALAALTLVEKLRSLSREEEALKHGRRGLAASPDDLQLTYLVAGLELSRKNLPGGAALLERVLEKEPHNINANRELARAILLGGLHGPRSAERALALAARALDLERSAANLDVYAFALFGTGRIPEAVSALEEAVQLDPQNRELRGRLERARAKVDQ